MATKRIRTTDQWALVVAGLIVLGGGVGAAVETGSVWSGVAVVLILTAAFSFNLLLIWLQRRPW